MNVRTNRILWIDWSKVLLIYLVVLAHYGDIYAYVDNLICHFHMPAFFFISGYLHKTLGVKESLFKNAKRLLIPALLFSLVCLIFYIAIDIFILHRTFSLEEDVIKRLLGIVCYDKDIASPPCGVIWFLEILFICKILLDALLKLGNRYILIFCILSVTATGIWTYQGVNDFSWLFYIQRLCINFPFMVLGFYFRRKEWITRMETLTPIIPTIILLLYLAGVYFNGELEYIHIDLDMTYLHISE